MYHPDSVFSIAFSPDGQLIATGCSDGFVRLWNLQGNLVGKPFEGHRSFVSSVAFSPDGKRIISGSDDNTIRLWDLQGHTIGQPIPQEGRVDSIAFSPDGRTIVTNADGKLALFDLQGNPIGQSIQQDTGKIYSIAFSSDGKTIATGSQTGLVQLWDANWESWLQTACNRLQYHPVFREPQTEQQRQARGTCQKYVWNHK